MNEFIWVEPLFLSNVVALASGPGCLCDSFRASGDPLGFSVLQEWEGDSVRSLLPMRSQGMRAPLSWAQWSPGLLSSPSQSLASYVYFMGRLAAHSCHLPVPHPLRGLGGDLNMHPCLKCS